MGIGGILVHTCYAHIDYEMSRGVICVFRPPCIYTESMMSEARGT